MQSAHFLGNLCIGACHHCLQIAVQRFIHSTLICHNAAKVLVAHGNGTVYQISQSICQIGIGSLRNQLPGCVSVIIKGHFMNQIVTDSIYAEEIHQIIHIDNISLGFTHLAAAHQKPGMSEHLLRQRLAQRHQENRPVNRMETDNILSNQMQVCGPVLFILLGAVAVRIISDSGNIVCQRIQPYINYVFVIKIHWDSPFKGGSGYAQILQPRKQEVVHHFIFTGNRLNKFRMLVNMANQPVSIFAHFEEICLFLGRLYRTAAVRALSVYKLGFCPEGLAGRTVHSLIGSLVNISLIIQALKNFLYLLLMIIIRCPDKFVVGNIEQIAQSLNHTGNLVNVLLGSNACLLCL